MRYLRTCGFRPSGYTSRVFSICYLCVCLIRHPVMKFIIRAKSANCSPLQFEGVWTLEAASREEAVSLMEQHISLLSEGATWTIRPWTPDDSEVSDSQPDSAFPSVVKPTAAA